MAEVTTGRERLLDEQRHAPPPPGEDRAVALFKSLEPELPAELLKLYADQVFVVGEVGKMLPAVQTAYPETGYSVEFTTGMFLYVDLIMKACSGTFIQGVEGAPALALDDVKTFVKAAATTYVGQTQAFLSVFAPKFHDSNIVVGASETSLRDLVSHCVKQNMLAHELAHVAMSAGIRPRLSANEEVDADTHGLSFFLPAASKASGWGVAVAGAGVNIRLFVTLQRLGLQLTDAYPLQDERLALLESNIVPLVGSAQRCDEVSTLMVSLLDLMDFIDDKILPSEQGVRYTVSHARVGLLARLREVAEGNLTIEAFLAMLEMYASRMDEQDLAAALNALCDYYWNWLDTRGNYIVESYLATFSFFPHGMLVAMSRSTRAIVAALPPKYRALVKR